MNNDKQIRKVLAKLRKMDHRQRYIIMDWLRDWYAYVKEQQLEGEEE